jgi:hypothetical protein
VRVRARVKVRARVRVRVRVNYESCGTTADIEEETMMSREKG